MAFDVKTILFLLFLASAVLALMLVVFWKTQKTYEGFNIWTFASVFASLGYLLVMLRGEIPAVLSIVAANACIVLAVIMRLDSMDRFTGMRKVPALLYAAIFPLVALLLYFAFVSDSVAYRGLVIAAVIIPVLVTLAGIVLWYGKKANRLICTIFAVALVVFAIVYALRSVYWAFIAPQTVFDDDTLNSLFFVSTLVADILATGLFLMLNMSRYGADLAASEDRYRTLADSLPDYVVVHDGKKILYANPASVQFTGIPADRITGTALEPFLAPENRERSLQFLENPGADAAVRPHEAVILSPEGKRHTCIAKSVPVLFGGSDATLSVLTDITDRKQAEETLRATNKKLNLLSGITRHDIRNQLLALDAYIELSRNAAHDPVALEEYVDKEQKITRNIAHQLSFTRDYEDMGVRSPEWQDVHAVVEAIRPRLQAGAVSLSAEEPGPEIFADPLLEKVFFNLFDNALRYGGSQLTAISVSSRTAGQDLVIAVQDNGEGIREEEKKQLFTKGFGKHTGLGLFLSREILSITGIAITETGTPGEGARFEICVPGGSWRYPGNPGDRQPAKIP